MALFNFGKKKEEEKKTPACACSCGCAASEAESITNDCCPDLKEGEICCIKVLAGCKSCHEQFEYTKQAVKDMGLSVEVEYITDMQKVAPVIADVFADGVFTAVIHQEMRAIDPFSGGRINLMDEKTAERLILNADRGGLAVFNLEIMRRIV